ncbi:MAG: hypothetical protein WC516_05145 [Patescibacteria group bacterium]|jgi:hypothetical protein
MIIAYTRIDKSQDVLIKKIKNMYSVEYRIDLNIITKELFKTFFGAEKFYSNWVQFLFRQGEDYE